LIGVRHLTEDTKSTVVRRKISDLAEVCLTGAAEIANREMARKFGTIGSVDALPFVIIGMGKLGGQEMTYLSDLDVIFVYEAPLSQIGKLAAHDWFSRFAGRIISVLNMHTSEGIVFQIDTRLRPSGNKGALVTSLESFAEYHKNTSALWEKQALIRARPVFGPDTLSEKILNITRDCVMRTPVSMDDLREIDRLRKRMQYELALEDSINVDLKTGEGGLVDVEFFVQAKILMHSHDKPQIIRTNTLDALYQLERAHLIDYRTFEILDSGYRFLSDLEDKIRIMEEKSVDRMPLTGEKLKGLAQRLGYRSGSQETLVQQYFRVSYEIRKIYNSLFDLA
jgi:glutamate-ammonia-ligase adenylyltransferase